MVQANTGREVTDAWQMDLRYGREAVRLCRGSLMTVSWRMAGLADWMDRYEYFFFLGEIT